MRDAFFTFMYLLFRFAHGPSDAAVVTQAWYTTDDGKTCFADDIKRIPPFDKDGKSAVRAYVFKCPGGRPFISHLERYTPEGRKALEQMQRDPNSPINIEDVMLTGIEVKKPGSDASKAGSSSLTVPWPRKSWS